MKSAEDYVDIIIRDETDKIAKETPTIYNPNFIERLYEFADGAVVRYEWQSTPDGRTSPDGKFNHRFSLVTPPSPNPKKFKPGVIRVIDYPTN